MALLMMDVLLPELYELNPLDLFVCLRCVCREVRDKLPGVDIEYIGIWQTFRRLRGLQCTPHLTWQIRRCFLDLRFLLLERVGSTGSLRLLCLCAPIIDRLLVACSSRQVILEGAELVMHVSGDVRSVGFSISARHFEVRRELGRLLSGVPDITDSWQLNISRVHCPGG